MGIMSKRKTQSSASNPSSPRNVARVEKVTGEESDDLNPPPHDFRHEVSTIEVVNIISPGVVNPDNVGAVGDASSLVATNNVSSKDDTGSSVQVRVSEGANEFEDGKSTSADSDHLSIGNSHMSNDSRKSVETLESSKKKPARKSDVAITYSPVKKGTATQVRVASGPFNCIFIRFDHGTRVNEDAYLRPFTDALDNPTSGAALANELRIVQICTRRDNPENNEPHVMNSGFNSKHMVVILPCYMENTEENRKAWTIRIITRAKTVPGWRYPASMEFAGDDTKMKDGQIAGKLDDFLLNSDIAGLLGKFIFEDVKDVIDDFDTINEIYGHKNNKEHCPETLSLFWNSWM